jgi:hypothetical protein
MPADGISLPPKKGTSARPAAAARTLGYINGATGRKGHDRLWQILLQKCPMGVAALVATRSVEAMALKPIALTPHRAVT